MFNIAIREKKILISGAVFVVLFCAFQFGIVPVFDQRETLTRILKYKHDSLEEMFDLQQQLLAVSNRFDIKEHMAPGEKNFSLFSFLDSLVQQSNIKENVVYMKPLTKKLEKSKYILVTVKVKLNDLYLKELIDFLYRVESSGNNVVITSLSLSKSGRDKNRLDAVIETQAFKLKGRI